MLRSIGTRAVARHAHVVGRRRSRAVRRADARVVLRAAPAEADTRVTNGVALHLVDGHLGSVAVDKLNEAAAFARGNLDVGDFAEALEERAELILGNVARETTDEDGRVVGVSELVHLSSRVVATIWEALHTTPHLLLRHATAHHLSLGTLAESMVATVAKTSLGLFCCASRVAG